MKRKICTMLGITMFGFIGNAQQKEAKDDLGTATHSVKQGETVMLISRKYLVKPEEIYKLNPDAVNGISANTILKLPPKSKLAEKRDDNYAAVHEKHVSKN